MKPYMVPLSTAIYDPAWFHKNKGPQYQWKDKNGVWNGLRAEPFAPGPMCSGLCHGREGCSKIGQGQCDFLRIYRNQLNQLDFDNIMHRIENICTAVQKKEQFIEDPIAILIFHEAYDNPCSERWPVQEWFSDHGYDIKEFKHE